MAAINPRFIARAVWTSGLRVVFTVFLVLMTWLALDRNFVIAGVVFLVFAVGLGILAFRKFAVELTRMRYAEIAAQQAE